MTRLHHLGWIAGAAAVGFTSAFVFADLLRIPAPAYHLVYFLAVGALVMVYVRSTRLDIRTVLRRRIVPALALGVLGGLVLVRRVIADAPSVGPPGVWYVWDLIWRGLIYGAVDGVLLSAFPWLVVWRAFDGESASWAKRIRVSLLAVGCVLIVTSAYHAGYPDFRGPKLLQANVGNVIASMPTLLSAHPVASPLAHAILHIAAVVHDPASDLFLPPHARRP